MRPSPFGTGSGSLQGDLMETTRSAISIILFFFLFHTPASLFLYQISYYDVAQSMLLVVMQQVI